VWCGVCDIEMNDLKHYDQARVVCVWRVCLWAWAGSRVHGCGVSAACGAQVNEQGAINTLGPLEAFGEKSLQQLFSAMMESWGGGAQTAVLKKRGRRFSHSSAASSVEAGGSGTPPHASPSPSPPLPHTPPDHARRGRVGFSFADAEDAAGGDSGGGGSASGSGSSALGGRNFFPGEPLRLRTSRNHAAPLAAATRLPRRGRPDEQRCHNCRGRKRW
jgi:hypothetical protein